MEGRGREVLEESLARGDLASDASDCRHDEQRCPSHCVSLQTRKEMAAALGQAGAIQARSILTHQRHVVPRLA